MSSTLFVFTVLCVLLNVFHCYGNANMDKYHQRKSKQFLEENAQKEGVVTTASGLQYKVLSKGTSKVSPTAADTVEVHYRGTLINGKEFDSSYKRGQPAKFGVGQVIKGWTEGLQLMSVGDKFEFYIPSELGYGAAGAGKDIPGHNALIFEVELIGIQGKNEL
eukprot:TRINITY_DN942_c0_g2_i1.p1 TRINITY_DN942_c0_g2~~TRINITY_DN942_c0_g2_i1.p1  ORF type:complete len:163 (+),score=40.20 TRINITY_DN942_c0_g2_i1:70-558(+)